MEEDGGFGGGGAGDAAEDGGADVGLEGGSGVDDNGVGCTEGFEGGFIGEGAVDDGCFAEVVEGGVEFGRAEEGGYGDVGVFFAEDFEEGSWFVGSVLCGIGDRLRGYLPPTCPEAPRNRTEVILVELRNTSLSGLRDRD